MHPHYYKRSSTKQYLLHKIKIKIWEFMPWFTKKHKVVSSVHSNGIFYLVNVSSYKFRLGSDEGSNVSFCSEGGIKEDPKCKIAQEKHALLYGYGFCASQNILLNWAFCPTGSASQPSPPNVETWVTRPPAPLPTQKPKVCFSIPTWLLLVSVMYLCNFKWL